MKIYSTREFRSRLAKCLSEAVTETVFVDRPGHKLIQLIPVPVDDVKTIKEKERR